MPSTYKTTQLAVPRGLQPYEIRYMDFRGGVVDAIYDEAIADNEMPDANNYIIDIFSGMLIKREGITRHLANQQSEAFTSIYDGVAGNYFSGTTTLKLFDNTSLETGLTAFTERSWTSMNSLDITADGVNAPRQTDGTAVGTVVLPGSPPTFKVIQEFKQMLFGGGHDGGKLRWSNVFTVGTWTSTNERILSRDEDNDLIGFAKFRDSLIVFMERAFHQIQATSHLDVRITYSNWEEGCTSHRSIVSTPYGVFFWSQNGLTMTDGQNVRYIMLEKLPNLVSTLNRAQDSLVHGVWNPNKQRLQYYGFKSTSNTQDIAFYYYPKYDSFFPCDGDGCEMGASGKVKISGVTDVYLGPAAADLYLYKNTGDTDDGTNISDYMDSKRWSTEFGPISKKRSRDITVLARATADTSLLVGAYIDNSTAVDKTWTVSITGPTGFQLDVDQLDVDRLGAGSEARDENIGFSTKFTKMKVRIEDTSAQRNAIRGILSRGVLLTS